MKRPAFALALAPALLLAGLGGYAALVAQPGTKAHPAAAQDPVPGKLDPRRVAPGPYTVDSAHTLVGWRVSHFGISDYFGIFGDITGTLFLDPQNPAASRVDIIIPVSKVTVASPGLRDHLTRPGRAGARPDFFGPAMEARFVSTSVKRTGPMKATIQGRLTLNNITRPVTLAAEFSGAGDNPMTRKPNVGFRARAALRRSDFGLNFAVPAISEKVVLDITAAFEQARPQHEAEPDGRDECRSAVVRRFVGQAATPAVRGQIERLSRAPRIRWIEPGSAVTMDYALNRLNVELDDRNIIRTVRCG